jgi:hypothetical protein
MHAVAGLIRATFQAAQEAVLAAPRREYVEGEDHPGTVDAHVSVSLATYLADRRPFASNELYDLLSTVDFDTLTDELARASGVPLQVRFIHDGTAAAAALASSGRDGVIVVGTSLGAGFTLPGQPRLPIADDLRVTYPY